MLTHAFGTRQLTKFKWEKKTWEGPVQYKVRIIRVFVSLIGLMRLIELTWDVSLDLGIAQNTDLGEELMMLPTDMALIEDEKFLPYVKKCTFSLYRGSWRVAPNSYEPSR